MNFETVPRMKETIGITASIAMPTKMKPPSMGPCRSWWMRFLDKNNNGKSRGQSILGLVPAF